MNRRALSMLGFLVIACLVATGFAAAKVQTTSSAPSAFAASN